MITAVRVHWNFHKKCYSVVDRKTGLVIEHTTGPVYLNDVTFVVRPGGHARVLKERKKNVHSFIRGSRTPPGMTQTGRGVLMGYDPYKADFWFQKETMRPVDSAAWVVLSVVDQRAVVVAVGPQFRQGVAA